MPVHPIPTLIYRMVHIDNLEILARRGGIHAPTCYPDDGLPYRSIHDESIRQRRGKRMIPCGPGGSIDDYVSFYLGPRSPMLYRIWRGAVEYEGGQRPVVYLVSSVQKLQELRLPFVFSDGHGLQALTRWFDNPAALQTLDWQTIQAQFWNDTEDDPDRCRRKQAELLVHHFVPWEALLGIAVLNEEVKAEVEALLQALLKESTHVRVRKDWYYLG